MTTSTPSENDLRSMLSEGQTLYQISRHFNTTIPEIFKLGRSYGIHFAYDHNHIPKPTKQDLESMYNDERMTRYQISREFDAAESTVQGWIHYYNIPTRGSTGTLAVPMPPKEVLERMYHDEGMTQYQISREFNVAESTVRGWLRYYNISTVGHKGAKVPMPPKEVIERMYIDERMSQRQIAKEFGVTYATVGRWLRYYNIQARGCGGTPFTMPPKDDLFNCIDNGLNQHQIAQKYNVSDWKIYDWCEHYGIPGMVNNFRCTTPEHINWRYAVFERDHHTCQKCGVTNTMIHPHHIVPFADHPEIAYELENGITLCEGCHYLVTGCEYDYIEQFAAITQPHLREHEVIESMPWEAPLPPLSDKLFPDYQQEAIPCLD